MSIISNQILRSATSVGANYRSARRAKSKRDFINKLKIVEEEADETLYWLGLIQRSGKIKPEKLRDLCALSFVPRTSRCTALNVRSQDELPCALARWLKDYAKPGL